MLRTSSAGSRQHRPVATVQADIDGLKAQRAWGWTNGCTKMDGKAERTLCDKFHALEAEVGSATQAGELEKRIADAQTKLAGQSVHNGVAEGDPQAAVLVTLLAKVFPSVKLADVQTLMTVFVALLLEVGSGLGMYVAFSQWRIDDVKEVAAPRYMPMAPAANLNTAAVAVAAPSAVQSLAKPRSVANDNRTASAVTRMLAPENDVERFYKENVGNTDGSSLTATELYEDYCHWCETKTKEPSRTSYLWSRIWGAWRQERKDCRSYSLHRYFAAFRSRLSGG